MILQSRTEKFYSIEMTEQQAKDLSMVFDGLQQDDIADAIMRMKGVGNFNPNSVYETVQTFRLALAEYQKL